MLCDVLVCGVISDEEVKKAKGPPIMNIKERAALARACKFVDEVVEDVPYDPTIELMDRLNCSHVAHGDDIAIGPTGIDCYH